MWDIKPAAIPIQSNHYLTSMETYTLLSLAAFIGLIIHFTSYGVSVLLARRRKSVVNGFVAEKESAIEKDNNEYRPIRVFIPNTLARWPWPRRINPHYAAVKKESATWTASFGAFSQKAQHAFNRCDFSKAFRPPTLTRVLTLFGRSSCLLGLSNSEER
jgi:hypothetical protein